MDKIYGQVHYWLVEPPLVREFEWIEGETWGSSTQFPAITVITYLSFVFIFYYLTIRSSLVKGPSISPTHIRLVSILHNLILVILSFTMAVGCAMSTASQMSNRRWIFCFPLDKPARGPVFFWAYVYYLSKILEFIDTLLIVLNRDARRLTFLHVYHHAAVVVMCFVMLQTRQSLLTVVIVLNSIMHTIMYTYYMMCALGVKPSWKKLVTNCQLAQLWTGLPLSIVMWWLHFTGEVGCSGLWSWFYEFVFVVTLGFLFSSFHAKNYGSGKDKKTA